MTDNNQYSEDVQQLLTDYLNDELDPPARLRCENMLAEDQELQTLLEEMNLTKNLLTKALETEPAETLTEDQRIAVSSIAAAVPMHAGGDLEALGKAAESRTFHFPQTGSNVILVRLLSMTTAALFLIGVGIVMFFVGRDYEVRRHNRLLADGPANTDPAPGGEIKSGVFDPRRMIFPRGRHEFSVPEFYVEAWKTGGGSRIVDNPFRNSLGYPVSAPPGVISSESYDVVSGSLRVGIMPRPGNVRVEELVNAFDYNYAPPSKEDSNHFALHLSTARCPWRPEHILARIAIKGREAISSIKDRNYVFLLDVSTPSMPLLMESIAKLTEQITDKGHIEILLARQGNVGEADFAAAFQAARKHYIHKGINSVVLCTEGRFREGTSPEALDKLIESQAKTGISTITIGIGMNHVRLPRIEHLAEKGNGHCWYADSRRECEQMITERLSGKRTLLAKKLNIQVEFNPSEVSEWRLIGCHEASPARDAVGESVSAREIYSGHVTTLLYELVPAGNRANRSPMEMKYQIGAKLSPAAAKGGLFNTSVSYRSADNKSVFLLSAEKHKAINEADYDADFRFASAVAGFGMILRNSKYRSGFTLEDVDKLASNSLGKNPSKQKVEFIRMVKKAALLRKGS